LDETVDDTTGNKLKRAMFDEIGNNCADSAVADELDIDVVAPSRLTSILTTLP
jgi:hypothetical protein